MDLGGDEHVPHLGPDRRQLGRVHRRALGVPVEELLELGQLVVGVGPGHRRREVVDDDGVGAALGLRALAGVVDDERVEERHVGDGDVGEAAGRQGQRLARQPLQRAVLAEVDDGVGAPAAVVAAHRQPAVERQVVVGRREVGGVVRADRVGPEAAWRLDRDEHAAEVDAGELQRAVGDVDLARRRAPHRLHLVAGVGGQRREPVAVGAGVPRADRRGDLRRGQRRLVVGEADGELVHQRVAVGRDAVDAVALVAHRVEQLDRRRRRVEADGVAEPGPLRRVGRQHDGDALVGVGEVAQAGRAHGEAGEAPRALGIGARRDRARRPPRRRRRRPP